MKDDEVIPIRKSVELTTVGGPVDETRVSLALYGEHLDPDLITRHLGSSPTASHRRGERKGPRSPEYRTGAWLLTIEGRAPTGPDELLRVLLEHFPRESSFWAPLARDYRIQVRIAIHTGGWNRGFDLSPDNINRVAAIGATIVFDLYFYGDDVEE